MVKRATIDLIRGAVVDGIRRNGERIFDISQQTENCYVPVRTGYLKENGGFENIPRGINLYYRTPYAADVEFGSPAKPIEGTETIHVKAHTRKGYTTKSGKRVSKQRVAAHDVVLKNKKMVTWEPRINKFQLGEKITRVISEVPEKKGQYFLTRAFYEGLPHLIHDINFYLQRLDNARSNVISEYTNINQVETIASRVENQHQQNLSDAEREFLKSEPKKPKRGVSKKTNKKKRK